ncbi:hypothetical protein Bca101_072753 [Brassica carinata]
MKEIMAVSPDQSMCSFSGNHPFYLGNLDGDQVEKFWKRFAGLSEIMEIMEIPVLKGEIVLPTKKNKLKVLVKGRRNDENFVMLKLSFLVVTGIARPSGSDKLYTATKVETLRIWDCASGQVSICLPLRVHSIVWLFFNGYLSLFDPERPKNDKATILTDTVQLLKELTSEVNKLKSEYSALADESREILNLDHKLQKSTGDLYNQGQCLRGELQWSHDGSTAIFSISNAYGHASWVNANASINAILHVLGNQNPSMMPAAPCTTNMPYMLPKFRL